MFFRKKKRTAPKKGGHQKNKPHKEKEDDLLEDPSIENEAHSLWEAEDIYDEDDYYEIGPSLLK